MGAVSIEARGRWIRWIYRGLLVGGFVLLLSYLPYRFLAREDQTKLEQMRSELSRVKTEIRKHEADLSVRRKKVEALKNDTGTIEDIARDELQMLYPHEKALRLKRKDQ